MFTPLFVHRLLLFAIVPTGNSKQGMNTEVWKMSCPFWSQCSLAAESWASYLVFLNLSFIFHEMRRETPYSRNGFAVRMIGKEKRK